MRGGLLGRARLSVEPIAATAVLVLVAWLAVADPAAPAPPSCTRVADSVSGSDQNDGSSGAPWRTAQKLVDNLAPGETGCLRAGRYREDVTVSHSGTAEQRITIRSQPGQVATIEGRVLVTADNVTLSQLVLDAHLATGGYGQVVEGDDVVFSDNNVTSGATASCFKVGNPGAGRAFRLQILRSRIHNCKTGVLVSSATHTAVLRNLIYDNVDRGVRLEPDATGGTVMRNVIDNNGEGVFFGGSATTAPDLQRRPQERDRELQRPLEHRLVVPQRARRGLQPRLEELPLRHEPRRVLQHDGRDRHALPDPRLRGLRPLPRDRRPAIREPGRRGLPPEGRQPVPVR